MIKRSRVQGREHEHMLEMEIEIMFQIKKMLDQKIDGMKSLCEIFSVFEDEKRVSYCCSSNRLDLLGDGVLWK